MRIPDSVRKAAYEEAWTAYVNHGVTGPSLSKVLVDTVIFVIEGHPDMEPHHSPEAGAGGITHNVFKK